MRNSLDVVLVMEAEEGWEVQLRKRYETRLDSAHWWDLRNTIAQVDRVPLLRCWTA